MSGAPGGGEGGARLPGGGGGGQAGKAGGTVRRSRWLRLARGLGRIDRRLIHLATLVVAVVAVLIPPQLTVRPRADTVAAYRLADGLQPGDAVFVWTDYGFGAQEELDPMLRALLVHLMRRGAILCFASRSIEGGQIAEAAMARVDAGYPAYRDGYGRTWVNLGFRPAPDIALRAATTDLIGAYNGVDQTGRPLDGMPLAVRLPALTPRYFRLAYVFDWGDGYAAMMTYVSQVTGVPMVVGAIAMEAPVIQPFVATGQIAAVIAGTRGAAEYEALLGVAGRASALDRGDVVVAVFVLLLLVAGNVGAAAETAVEARGGN